MSTPQYAQHKQLAPSSRRSYSRLWLFFVLPPIVAAAGFTLATNYPIAPILATLVFAAACVAFFAQAELWMVAVPALLPLLGFAPWTGWITFEEMDLLVLAAAAGGYARLAWRGLSSRSSHSRHGGRGTIALAGLLYGLFAVSTLIAMFRGIEDGGGMVFGWFQGYLEPMNSVRLAKSVFEALLLLPLWRAAQRRHPQRAQAALSLGLTVGLLVVSLLGVWERVAFTGLMDFSSDYRITALFWEMHVGGAALDGFLAMTVPFALREMLVARTAGRWALAGGTLVLAAYACLTTFSRGVYVAIPAGAVVLLALHAWQLQRSRSLGSATAQVGHVGLHLPTGIGLVGAFACGALWLFQTSGFRGIAALLMGMVLMLPLNRSLRGFAAREWTGALMLGAVLAVLAWLVAAFVPKGAYVAFIGFAVASGALLFAANTGTSRRRVQTMGVAAFACFVACTVSTALVAYHWGGMEALTHALPVTATVLVVSMTAGARRHAVWPDSVRWQATTAGAMALVAGTVGVLGGGAYMGGRFSTGERDLDYRLAHWQLGRDMLTNGADWVLGKGLGRFPANHFLAGDPQQHPGDYRLKHEGTNGYLMLTGGLHVNGWGEIFRVTQRVDAPGPAALVTAQVRTDNDIALHFEVCEKHLLYNRNCLFHEVNVKGEPGVWQSVRMPLTGEPATRGSLFAPRLIAFSVAVGSRGAAADLDQISLLGADGRQLLSNGDFSEGMAHWFFSSDKFHMPWHMKNMFMNVLFDQGALGVIVWSLMLAGALLRTSVGNARSHPLAPALAASLVGFAAVGMFDSLLDVPRLATLFYLLLLIAMTVSGSSAVSARSAPDARRQGRSRAAAPAMLLAFCIVAAMQAEPARAQASKPSNVTARAAKVDSLQIIRVGPTREFKTLGDAARIARDGAIVEVDAGDYAADVAVWNQDQLTIRSVGGPVRLRAAGAAAEGKAIWVVRGGRVTVDGFEFSGAKVADRNGAGIRLEKGALIVRNSVFSHNENGILTSNDPRVSLQIVDCEFGYNGFGDGQSHNVYVGEIASLSVAGSYFHHANVGHLLKTRAAVNDIRYNRLTDERGGRASYELEFASGGIAYVVGNIIEQAASTENPHIISFGVEGYKWPKNELYLINNALIDNKPQGGTLLRVRPGAGTVQAVNNLLMGRGKLEAAGAGDYRNNFTVAADDFKEASRYDFRLKHDSPLVGKAVSGGSANGVDLRQQAQYKFPTGTQPLPGGARDPGPVHGLPRNPIP